MLLSPRTATGVLPRNQTVRALLWAAVLGILGVMTGLAGFVAWVAEDRKWWKVLSVLLIVAVIAAIGERAREIISHGGGNSHGRAAQRQERLARTILTILAGFVIVLLFEIANAAWDKGSEKLTETLNDIISIGNEPIETRIRLVTVALVWIASGAVVAMVLVRRILSMAPAGGAVVGRPSPAPEEIPLWQARAASWLGPLWRTRVLRDGLVAAAIAGGTCALLLFASVLLLEGVSALYAMVMEHRAWRTAIDALARSGGIVGILALPALWLGDALNSWFLPFLQRLWWVFALGAGYLWWNSAVMRTIITVAVVAVVFVPPVALVFPALLHLSGLYAVVWAVPAFVLGAASPHLRDYRPHQWGFIACIVSLGLGLLAALQAHRGISDVLSITAICASLTLLIGLILIFLPPTRDYLPLIAAVCGLSSYGVAAFLATPGHIIENIVFLHAPASEPKQLCDATPQPADSKRKPCDGTALTALAPPSPFILRLEGRNWEIGKEVYGKVQNIVKLDRKHKRWAQTRDLLSYVNYLRDPAKYSWFSKAVGLISLDQRARIPHVDLFMGSEKDAGPGQPCPRSPIVCLAELPPAPVPNPISPGWTPKMLKEWTSAVAKALEDDLRWRWRDEAIGAKLHIALSAAIGFFLALAALIAWQIRNACEVQPKRHTGW
jgi:hypothetical protein